MSFLKNEVGSVIDEDFAVHKVLVNGETVVTHSTSLKDDFGVPAVGADPKRAVRPKITYCCVSLDAAQRHRQIYSRKSRTLTNGYKW